MMIASRGFGAGVSGGGAFELHGSLLISEGTFAIKTTMDLANCMYMYAGGDV